VTARRIARRVFGFADDCLVLAIVANLIGYKGHADLLDALAFAHSRLAVDWRLLAVGRDDGEGARLRQRAEALGIAPHIWWAGERQDVAQFFAAADIVVVASHEEGFSNSLIEAMAHGLPVVATAVGGNLDAVVAGETGLVVPSRAPAAMADAIVALAAESALRAGMGDAGRQRAAAEFGLDACVAGYLALYRKLLKIDISQ
jgi:glycosyltransferase involved in cell wall biosynthesis